MSIFDAVLSVDASKEYPVGMIIINIFWAIVLGYFALRFDSDPEVCMATDANDFKFKKGANEEMYIDVGEEFRLFFEIGFFGYVAQITLGMITYMNLESITRQIVFFVNTLLSYAIFMAWIWGFYCRMSHSGCVCSGDFLEDNEATKGFLI